MRLFGFLSRKGKRGVPLDAIALLLAINVAMGALGSLYGVRYSSTVRGKHLEQLDAIATLKQSQISAWRSERLYDAWIFFENSIVSRVVTDLIVTPRDATRRATLEQLLETRLRMTQYRSTSLIARDETLLLTFPREASPLTSSAVSIAVELAKAASPSLSDPFLEPDGVLRALLVSPVHDPSTGTPMGAMVFDVDPQAVLYPLIADWPVPSRTAEALIVRERDGRVLYLSPLRFHSGNAFLTRSASGQDSPVSGKAVRGLQGPTEGFDYRGIPVFATVREVSGLAWYLVVKIDREEIDADIRSGSLLGLIALSLLQVILSALVIVRWSRQTARATAERERLSTRLTKARELESVAMLAAGVAHDFNNTLASISGYAEVLKSRAPETGLREYAEKILAATRRAAYVVHGLLSFSEQRQVRSESIELNDFLRGQRESLAAVLGPHVTLRLETSTARIRISGDRDQLETVLRHLADNSRDAMPGGGTFTVRTDLRVAQGEHGLADGRAGRRMYATLVVTDTGSGIPIEMQEKIFEPFFTLKSFGKSAGIGLAAVYGIVRQHGGSIEVESAPGKGATFTIWLPLPGPKATTDAT